LVFKKEDGTTFARPACPDGRLGGMVENLATPEQLGRSGRLFGQVVLKPGEAIANHVHRGEFEVYYMLSGSGEYSDNGKTVVISAGDTTYCRDGEMHGLENNGDSDIVMIAFVGYTK
jgi:quercetin dioxygenase-like cupin family protein